MLGPVDWRCTYAQKLGASGLLQFWRLRRGLLHFWRRSRFFLVNFGVFRRFLKRRKTAEDVVNYQFWRRRRFLLSKEFCKDNLYYTVGYV